MKILVYCGLYQGHSFKRMVDQNNYDLCIGFEANPHLIPMIKQVVGEDARVKIFNMAVSNQDGYVPFKISINQGQSSSISDFNPEWTKINNLYMEKSIVVKKINLLEFLKQEGLTHITDYVSDIQGHDYQALTSLKLWIDDKKIQTIQCEVAKPGKSCYSGVDNSVENFEKLLGSNYKLTSTGWGDLVDGTYNQVPEDWWEYDAKWTVVA